MASNAHLGRGGKTAANANKKMFNNFLEQLDISAGGAPHGHAMNLQQRTKSTNHGKAVAHQMRAFHSNTVHGTHASNAGAGKRNKQLVATSYNMAPAQLAQAQTSQSYAAIRMSHPGFQSNAGGGSLGPAGSMIPGQNLNSSLGLATSIDLANMQAPNSGLSQNQMVVSGNLNSTAGGIVSR